MKIYQLTNHSRSQMMGYIIVSKSNKVVVIDGGCFEDSDEIRSIIKHYDNHVDIWLLTHPHYDHNSVLIDIIKRPDGISVDDIYYSYLPDEWGVNEPAYHQNIIDLNAVLTTTIWNVHDLKGDERLEFDEMTIDVLAIANPDIIINAFNNSSCVFKIYEDDFTFLILGDLGVEGGQRLIKNHDGDLKSVAVQMAHHGQNGVSFDIYKAIAPKFAFWPTPDWLWNNTSDPGRPGEGPWKTLEIRRWMDELNTINITSFDRTAVFDTESKNVHYREI